MKKYNHVYALAFSVDTDRHMEAPVNPFEIIAALLKRVADVTEHEEWDEALGVPYDTYENEPSSERPENELDVALAFTDALLGNTPE